MKNLKSIRQSLALTQKDVSSSLSIPMTTYATYEQNKAMPSENMLIQIADFFGCSVDYLLGHETKGIIHLDSYTPLQQKLLSMIKQLNDDQTLQLFGYCSGMLGIPFDNARPPRPW